MASTMLDSFSQDHVNFLELQSEFMYALHVLHLALTSSDVMTWLHHYDNNRNTGVFHHGFINL